MKLLLLLLSLQLWAGPLVVGKGAGESEFALVFAKAHLPELLSHCLGNRCGLDSDQNWVLRRMIHFAPRAPAAVFKTSQELGKSVYEIRHGKVEVWFNQDLLWQDAARTKSFDEAFAVSVWMDVLEQILPDMVTVDFKHMKRLVRAGLTTRVVRTLLTHEGGATAAALIYKGNQDRLYLRDESFAAYEVTENLAGLSLCQDGSKATPRFHSARWAGLTQTGGRRAATLELTQTWACSGGAYRARVKLVVDSRPGQQQFLIDPQTVRVFTEGE